MERMRNSRPGERNTWATYARAAREAAGLDKTDLAKRMGSTRQTIGRWESGRYKPATADDVIAFARATGVDEREALAAAGILPVELPPERPTRPDPPMDPDVLILLRKLADPDVSPAQKHLIRGQLQYLARLADSDSGGDVDASDAS